MTIPTGSPTLSILTPSYNQGRFLEQTILSVLHQRYAPFEHIVVDGGSTDDTLAVLRRYPHVRWISERDNGQADALNKALALATGEIIGWINSDDYYDTGVFHDVAAQFHSEDVRWVLGNLTVLNHATGVMRPTSSPLISRRALLRNPDIVRQPGVFMRRSFLAEAGGWNERFFMAMDFDLWIRLASKSIPKMIDTNYAFFRVHSSQKSTAGNLSRQRREILEILTREGASLEDRARVSALKRWQALLIGASAWLSSFARR